MAIPILKLLLFVSNFHVIVGESFPQCTPQGIIPDAALFIPRCGDVLTAEKGVIYYVPLVNAFVNERCFWIIAVPEATTYDISVVRLHASINQPGGQIALIITDEDLKNVLPTCESWCNIMSRVLIITFATGENATWSSGFTLEYEVKEKETLNGNSSHYIRTQPSRWTKYPPGAANYNNSEYSVQVFPPLHNRYTGTNSTLRYKVPAPYEDLCQMGHKVNVYKFRFSTIVSDHAWWGDGKSFCFTIPSQLQLTHEDALLTVFRSDRSRSTTPGFWLHYA